MNPTWQTNPSSRIAKTVSRSYLPRFGSRLTWVRSVGVKSLMPFSLVRCGPCARAKLASRGLPPLLRGKPGQQVGLGEGLLPDFVASLLVFRVAQVRVRLPELLHHFAHQKHRHAVVGLAL